MDPITVKIVNTHPSNPLPEYMSEGASGLDLRAALEKPVDIQPGRVALIGTGIYIAIPQGYEGQVRPRSGLAMKHQIGVLNSPGTIDSDYRGEIGVLLFNFGSEPFTVEDGERIAQLIISAVPNVVIKAVDTLDDTERGSGGFGHTGR